MDCCLPGSSVHRIFQARISEWVVISFSRGSFRPRDRTHVSCSAGRFFTTGPPEKPILTTFSSVQFSCSVLSDSLWPHEPQHARPPCPSPTPEVHPNPCPSSQWCHTTISSSVVPFSSCPQSFPESGSFPMSQLFASGGQCIGVSASTSVLPVNTQDWSPLGWTGWISLQSKGLSIVFSQHHTPPLLSGATKYYLALFLVSVLESDISLWSSAFLVMKMKAHIPPL